MLKRVERVLETVSTIDGFDLHSQKHLRTIDARLNQNLLVGAAVDKLSQSGEYARGETFLAALLAFVPRALWPNKPVLAGSSDLASRFTGFRFAKGTSVGIGQVMEFYANFGTWGVWIGFLLMGIVVTLFDSFAREDLLRGDWQGYSFWIMIGLSFLLVGGVLVEATASAGAAFITMTVINRLLERFRGRRLLKTGGAGGISPNVG